MIEDGRNIPETLKADAKSIGALHGSARGRRNIEGRLAAMRRLAPLEGDRLLDVGCGTGEYTRAMAPRFTEIDAIDIELDRLDVFRRNLPENVTLGVESVNELPFADGSFDTVTMIEVLEHLSDPVVALREIRRVLRPGGWLLLTTPNRLWPFEQHGVRIAGRRFPGYALPGLVWVGPLHRRISNSAAFTPADLRRIGNESRLPLVGVTYMMPPLDSLSSGHIAHRLTDGLERTPARRFGQTIIGGFCAD